MAENKDLGGRLNALDLDRVFDDSVVVTVPFSIKRQKDDPKESAIKGDLKFNFDGLSQRDALSKACDQLKVDWARTVRIGKSWIGPIPKAGETIPIKVATYFDQQTKTVALTPENFLAQHNGDLESAMAALRAAAEANAKAEKDAGITHISEEDHEKFLAAKREKYLADEAEKQAAEDARNKAEQDKDKDKTAKDKGSKKKS